MKKHQEGWGCVYSAVNLINNLEYIGKDKTGDPENHRWKHHRNNAIKLHPKHYFQCAIKKAGGPEAFRWSIVWHGPLEQMNAKEVYYIKKRHTFVGDPLCRGYNLTPGGDGGDIFTGMSAKKKAAFRARVSVQYLGVKKSAEHAAKISASHKGKKPTELARAHMRAAHLGVKTGPQSEVHKARIGNSNRGRKPSDATKLLMSAAHSGHAPTRGTLGMKFSKETRRKMCMAQKARRAREVTRLEKVQGAQC